MADPRGGAFSPGSRRFHRPFRAAFGRGFAALTWLTYGLLPTSMPEFALAPALSTGTAGLGALVGVGVVALAPLFTWRRLTRMDLPAKLRVVE
jgi:putative ABC transport system permease protein